MSHFMVRTVEGKLSPFKHTGAWWSMCATTSLARLQSFPFLLSTKATNLLSGCPGQTQSVSTRFKSSLADVSFSCGDMELRAGHLLTSRS